MERAHNDNIRAGIIQNSRVREKGRQFSKVTHLSVLARRSFAAGIDTILILHHSRKLLPPKHR
jgi:hypothetical protein